MEVKKGQFVLVDPKSIEGPQRGRGQKNVKENPGGSDEPTELERAPEDVDVPGYNPSAKGGTPHERTLTGKPKKSTKEYTSKRALGQGAPKQKVSDFWERTVSAAMSSASSLSEKARRLLVDIKTNKPKVNWRKELKKFFDQIANKFDIVLPNKRLLAGGDIVYGRKRVGKDTIRTLVLPVDTSSSISKDQIKVFLEEVWRLSTSLDIDETYIIYCSDNIDNIDIVKKGGKPDLDKIASTGGNAKGFLPPFHWLQNPKIFPIKGITNKIDPTVVIYLTDSFAQYPSVDQFGINKYKDRVFWFIANTTSDFDKPPFGKYIHVRMDSKGNFL
jgi:predicted metal-dependent peptidase